MVFKSISLVKTSVSRVLNYFYSPKGIQSISARIPDTLAKLFEFVEIGILDIGARGGPMEQIRSIAPYSHLYTCEPDEKEREFIIKNIAQNGNWKKVTAIGEALYKESGEVTLHLSDNPGLSSLLNLSTEETNKFYSISKWDRHVSDVVVKAITLDEAFEKYRISNLAMLKLDTQGTELDILKSGEIKVIPSILCIYVEAEFIPIYRDQKLFSDMDAFLDKKHFRLFDIKRTGLRRRTKIRPIYSKRELAWAHVLYFREKNDDGSPLSALQKVRLACLAVAFEYFDYAIWLLENAEIKAFLLQNGIANAEKAVADYSDNFWGILQKYLNWREKREFVGTISGDKKRER